MKVFISYSVIDKKKGGYIKELLDSIGVDSFLAHNDINVSDVWEKKILSELKSCNIFIPVLSKSFKNSDWCGQEAGLAFNRNKVLIIPISIDGTNPYGFISHIHAHKWRSGELHSSVIINAIGEKWPKEAVGILLSSTEKIHSYAEAESVLKLFVPYYQHFTKEQANILASRAVENHQIWGAHKCNNEYLPSFLEVNANKLDRTILKALKYQVENKTWFRE